MDLVEIRRVGPDRFKAGTPCQSSPAGVTQCVSFCMSVFLCCFISSPNTQQNTLLVYVCPIQHIAVICPATCQWPTSSPLNNSTDVTVCLGFAEQVNLGADQTSMLSPGGAGCSAFLTSQCLPHYWSVHSTKPTTHIYPPH